MHSMQKVVSLIIRAMGTPLAHKAVKLWDQGDYASLINLKIDPGDYARASYYKLDSQVIATFKKLEGLPTGQDLTAKAVNSFYRCESICEKTNKRWAQYNNWFERGFVGDLVDSRLFDHLITVKRMIADVLGPLPKDLVPRFSTGSTFNNKGEEITIPHKISTRPTITAEGWTIVRDLWSPTLWGRACDMTPEIVLGNRFATVPKDSDKDRGIGIGPSLLTPYQLAVGAHMCERLRRIGIYIKSAGFAKTAQTIHQELAQKASTDGLQATLDLSDASDNVSYMLVKTLLPKGWFELLSALREPYTLIEGKWVKLHKFSAMGCGFTFELETLIFWALAQSVSQDKVLTYGDDIIVRTCDSACVVALLTLAGFSVNTKKSFWDPIAPFRESCGGDFFDGEAVRPTYLKVIPSTPAEWIVLANLVKRIRKSVLSLANESLLERAWRICINQVARNYRVFGPEWAGDMVIHSEDRSRWKTRPAKCEEGLDRGYLELKVLCPDIRRLKLESFRPYVQLASALLQVPSTGPVPRDGISGYKTTWRATVM